MDTNLVRMAPADAARIRGRIATIGVTHRRLAAQVGLSPAALSLILSGARPMPSGFAARIERALNTLAAAERAAAEARDRVLAGPPEAA